VFAVGGIFYLLAVPHYPFLLLGPAASFLKINPVFVAAFYWPLILLAVLSVAQHTVGIIRPQWSWYPAAAKLFSTGIGLLFVHFIIAAAGQTPGAEWHPYVTLSVSPTDQLKKMEAIVNASILMAMAAAWFGMCIAAVIQTWELLRQIRRSRAGASKPAVLNLL
jgi:hypothetical protein